jgi:hypothetical protein
VKGASFLVDGRAMDGRTMYGEDKAFFIIDALSISKIFIDILALVRDNVIKV